MFATALRCARQSVRLVDGSRFAVTRTTNAARRFLCEQPKEMVKVTSIDRQALLKAKMYKTPEDIPEYVTVAQIKKARDLLRVRVNIWMVVATVGGCIFMIMYGRYLRDSGDSLQKRGLEWEATMREQGLREEAEQKAQKAPAS